MRAMFKSEKIAYLAAIAIGLFFGIFFCPFKAHATLVTIPTTWKSGDSVTDVKLNNINNAFANVINGSLDNTNMSSGYRLLRSVSALPAAGNQGSVSFLTSDNTLYVDNGSAWVGTISPSGTLGTGKIPYYNSGWHLLDPGTQYYSLVSNGTSSLPTYQKVSLVNGVTDILPAANSQTIDQLLPSQGSNSGKFLKTNGAASSWATVDTTSRSILSNSLSITTGTDVFTCPGCVTTNATQTNRTMVFPKAGTVRNLYVHRTTTTNTVVVVAWKNTSSQSLTATVANTSTDASDTTNSFTVVAGDTLTIEITNNGSTDTISTSVEMDI